MRGEELFQQGHKLLEEGNAEEGYQLILESALSEEYDGALYFLGEMYRYGMEPVHQDYVKAFDYYRKAFDLAEDHGMSLYIIYDLDDKFYEDPENCRLYVKYLEYLAEHGNVGAYIYLGSNYENGDAFPQDTNKAIEYYLKAAEGSEGYGYECIGNIYFEGKHIEPDYEKAYEYFTKEEGFRSPMKAYCLAKMYEEGLYVKPDPRKAGELFCKAAYDFCGEEEEVEDDFVNKAREVINKDLPF